MRGSQQRQRMRNAVIMPGFIDLNALGDIDHDILHTRRLSAISGAAWNPSRRSILRRALMR